MTGFIPWRDYNKHPEGTLACDKWGKDGDPFHGMKKGGVFRIKYPDDWRQTLADKPSRTIEHKFFTYDPAADSIGLCLAVSVNGSEFLQVSVLPLTAIMDCIPQILEKAKNG